MDGNPDVHDIPDLREMLRQIPFAIFELATGKVKAYTLGSRSFTYYDLSELRKFKRDLEQDIANEETPDGLLSGTYAVFFDRR